MNSKNKILNFIFNNKLCWIITAVVTFALHASMLLGRAIGIDSEALKYYGRDFYQGWLNSGRQGLVLTKMIIMGGTFNIYVCGILTILFTIVACMAWTYMLSEVRGDNNLLGNIVFSLIICTHTIITEQMYFRIQSAEIMIGFALTAVSILLLYRNLCGLTKGVKSIVAWLLILILNLITFSMYQVMIPLYIFGCVAVLYIHYVVNGNEHPWITSFKAAGVFILTFVVNEIITLLFFNGSSYLNEQISWGRESIGTCVYQIISHMVRAGIIGKRIYFVPTYIIFVVLLFVLTYKLAKKHDGKLFYPFVLAVFIAAAPFYMTIICGGEVVIRAQLVLPFTIAFMSYLLVDFVNWPDGEKRKYRIFAIAVIMSIIFTLTHQTVGTIRLNHTDRLRYSQDESLAYELIDDINEVQNSAKDIPVAFVGRHTAALDTLSIKNGDVIGYSFFDWDTDPEPYSYHSSLRIIGFMSTLGTTYTEPDTAKMSEICDYSHNMPNYPESGSVVLYDDVIVVKLSE